MTHRRTEVRHKVLAALQGVASASGNVHPTRERAIQSDRFPALVFDEVDEARERISKDPEWQRTYRLRAVILATSRDERDQVELELEQALAGIGLTPRQGGEASTGFDTETSGERAIFSATVDWNLIYSTQIHAPDQGV